MVHFILTSDDFGMSRIYNKEMIAAARAGWLSSISIMTERNIARHTKQVEELLEICKNKPLSLGLHLEINRHKPVLEQCASQWGKFCRIVGRDPDYVDIHKDHLFKSAIDSVASFCVLKNVAFRKYSETTVSVESPDASINASYLDLDDLLRRITSFEGEQFIEVVFHIGTHDAEIVSSLNREREGDLVKLHAVLSAILKSGMTVVNYKMIGKKTI